MLDCQFFIAELLSTKYKCDKHCTVFGRERSLT